MFVFCLMLALQKCCDACLHEHLIVCLIEDKLQCNFRLYHRCIRLSGAVPSLGKQMWYTVFYADSCRPFDWSLWYVSSQNLINLLNLYPDIALKPLWHSYVCLCKLHLNPFKLNHDYHSFFSFFFCISLSPCSFSSNILVSEKEIRQW